MANRRVLLLAVLFGAACGRPPTRGEALDILRTAKPSLDTATAVTTVWQDGPPWFSCAEVIAKFRARSDAAAVSEQIGNWRSLVLADWMILRDTVALNVVEPGWCAASLKDSTARIATGWQRMDGDSLPSGARRRGWSVTIGRQRVVVKDAPRAVGQDSVAVTYLLTVAPNANGVALGVDKDSVRQRALLGRDDGKWVVLSWR